jgi:hypothetical protein
MDTNMTEEVSANPSGAESKPLTVNDAANHFLNMMSPSEATSETEVDEPQETEEPTETEQSEPVEAESQEPAAENTDEPEEQPTRRYKVKANGEEIEVTFDELKKGYQLESDYRKKTSELAEQRKQLEAERQRTQSLLNDVLPTLQKQLHGKFADVDLVQLSKDDPAQYVALQAEYIQQATQLQIAQAEQERLAEQQKQEYAASQRDRLTAEKAKLVEKLPIFADKEKSKTAVSELKGYLREVGYSDDDINNLSDHRATVIAWEAAQYRKSKKTAAEASKRAVNVPKVQKPGTPTRTDPKQAHVSAAMERFKKTGKQSDLAAVFLAQSTNR